MEAEPSIFKQMDTYTPLIYRMRSFICFVLIGSLLNMPLVAEETLQLASNTLYQNQTPVVNTSNDTGPSLRNKRRLPSSAAVNKKSSSRPVAQIVSVKKKVEIKPSGNENWSSANNQTPVKSDDKIRTGSKSIARVKMSDGSTVLLLQNSEAEMENLSNVKKSIKLLRGKIRAIIKSLRNKGDFQIKTPIGVASVRGTEFEVEFHEDSKQMAVDVMQGEVGVSKLGEDAREIIVTPGEKIQFGAEGEIGNPVRSGAVPMEAQDVQVELVNDQVKQNVIAMAAEEERNADYQVGKSLIDVDGKRVRVEEYIMRPAANQFKLVSLNERSNHFDYFTYKGTFNTSLPEDLSVALKQVGGKAGVAATAPDYFLTDYEMLMSNTKDNITDAGTGGHLVQVTYDGTNYTLSDPTNGANTKTVAAAALQNDGSYKIYDPVHDTFSLVSAANLTDAQKFSILDPDSGSYRNFTSADTLWRTRFNTDSYAINNTLKTAFSKKSTVTNTLAIDLDSDFTNAPITSISEYPSGDGVLHNRLSLFYSDGSKTVYDNYIINDEGKIGNASSFDGLATSESYKNELVNWNYQQKVKSTEMSDEINLVIDPRIGTISGLIQ